VSKYQIRGRSLETKRVRSNIYEASNKEEAEALARNDLIEPTDVEELPPEPPNPPTEAQLDYAEDLGISVPKDATRESVSALISVAVAKRALERYGPAPEWLKDYARFHGVDTEAEIPLTEYGLLERIKESSFAHKSADDASKGLEHEAIRWYVMNLVRYVCGEQKIPPRWQEAFEGEHAGLIKELTEKVASTPGLRRSVLRDHEPVRFIRFSTFSSERGRRHTTTIKAFQELSSEVRQRLGLPEPPRKAEKKPAKSETRTSKTAAKSSGKPGSVGWLILLLIMVAAMVVYFMFSGN
jgi:hypothetical protein